MPLMAALFLQASTAPSPYGVLPKGTTASDMIRCERVPSNTRPLALGNCDSKVVVNTLLVSFLAASVPILLRVQRTALEGRQMCANVLEIETLAIRHVAICGYPSRALITKLRFRVCATSFYGKSLPPVEYRSAS